MPLVATTWWHPRLWPSSLVPLVKHPRKARKDRLQRLRRGFGAKPETDLGLGWWELPEHENYQAFQGAVSTVGPLGVLRFPGWVPWTSKDWRLVAGNSVAHLWTRCHHKGWAMLVHSTHFNTNPLFRCVCARYVLSYPFLSIPILSYPSHPIHASPAARWAWQTLQRPWSMPFSSGAPWSALEPADGHGGWWL